MKLYTVSVDSQGYSEDRNDLMFVAAKNDEQADDLASGWVRSNRPENTIERVEVYEYAGKARVLAPFDPNEED
jgi:hypothetical protein